MDMKVIYAYKIITAVYPIDYHIVDVATLEIKMLSERKYECNI